MKRVYLRKVEEGRQPTAYGLERWHLDRIDARSVSENTPPGENAVEPVIATADYTLTYSLAGRTWASLLSKRAPVS